MEEQQITLSKTGNVYIVTLTGSPHKANVFTIPLLHRLDCCLDQVEGDIPCALIFTGTGKFFSAGFDIEALTGTSHNKSNRNTTSEHGGGTNKTSQGQKMVHLAWKVLARLLVFPVPTITVFNGHAFGLGLFIGLACDHRIMIETEKAFLCLPEITIGLPLGAGFAALVKCKMNPTALKISALTGKQWSHKEALQHEIIDALVPPASNNGGVVPNEALQLAEELVSTSKTGNLSKIKMELYGEAYDILAQRRRSRL